MFVAIAVDLVRASTPVPTPTPTPTPTPGGGLGAAVWLLGLFIVSAVVVTVGGVLIAGWVAARGRLVGRPLTAVQRRLFAVSAVGFGGGLVAVLLQFSPASTVLFYSAVAVGGVALVLGVGSTLIGALRDRFGE